MKYNVIVSDPPWPATDELKMSAVKRGASSQYSVLDIQAIKDLKVSEITADDAVLALWVPSWLLQEGLDTMKAWGFRQTQTHIWVKSKINPLATLRKKLTPIFKDPALKAITKQKILKELEDFDLTNVLQFFMGRLFRQTHEICLIGVKGKIYSKLKNKSQRSVHFDTNKKHSAKPETLQDMLELMFPNCTYLEMFARRSRTGWTTVGNQCPTSKDEDIRDSLERLSKL
jgi:N6-adenosine-specific RNA methylase IME4